MVLSKHSPGDSFGSSQREINVLSVEQAYANCSQLWKKKEYSSTWDPLVGPVTLCGKNDDMTIFRRKCFSHLNGDINTAHF